MHSIDPIFSSLHLQQIMNTKRIFLIIVLLLLVIDRSAADFDVSQLQTDIYKTIEAVQPAVVSIRGSGSSFSGVIVSSEGHVLSAGHAVRPGTRYQVTLPDGRHFTARGRGTNPQADCALVKITDDVDTLPFARMGDSSNLVANQPCLGISYPGGQGPSKLPAVRFGRIVRSGLTRGMLQSTALMEPGDSGGALFDLNGRVIGIHSRIGRKMDRNYEVPIDVFKTFWNELNSERSFTQSGPPRTKLGFRGVEQSDGTGIAVDEVIQDSVAEKHGIQVKDVIQMVYGKAIKSVNQLRTALAAARDDGADPVVVKLLRGKEKIELEITLDIEPEAPKVELPSYEPKEFPAPKPIKQLANLPREFSELEDQLDDVCIDISSKFGVDTDIDSFSIVGTMIKGTNLVVSKNSMVGDKPTAKIEGKDVELEIVTRDQANDLILLKTPNSNLDGIDLSEAMGSEPAIGNFVLAPDADGSGLVSVVSTRLFKSQKQASRGYLGVVPATYKNSKGAELKEVNDDGAAKRAGLKVGDVVTKMNDTKINTHRDMRTFLTTVDPKVTIIATLQRDDKELQKSITLGAYPSTSNHAADNMDKSGRRDGFTAVIPHDADLQPEKCGGPIFDLAGNFIGLNIARNSRVRSYAIPGDVVKQFVDAQK